jgi:hypothetical protein
MAMSCWSPLTRAAELHWLGESECRREAEVREQIESMTQRPLASVQSADFELEPLPLESGAFRLQLTSVNRTTGARETRVMQGASCAEVTDAAAVAIALAVGSEPDQSPMAAHQEPVPATNTPPSVIVPRADAPLTDVKAPPPARWLVGVGATFDSAVTPRPVPGAALLVGIRWRALRAELEAGAFVPSSTRDAQAKGGKFQLLYVAPRASAAARLGRSILGLGLAYELGSLEAEGEGVERPYSRSTLWHAIRPEVGFAWPLAGRLWLSGRAGTAVALARHTFFLDGPDVVHRPSRLSLRAAVGLELEL